MAITRSRRHRVDAEGNLLQDEAYLAGWSSSLVSVWKLSLVAAQPEC
jgi:hypothetical protein